MQMKQLQVPPLYNGTTISFRIRELPLCSTSENKLILLKLCNRQRNPPRTPENNVGVKGVANTNLNSIL